MFRISGFRIFAISAFVVAVAATAALFTSTRDFRPVRYYMPGGLGAQRIPAIALRATQYRSTRSGTAEYVSASGKSGYVTRVIDLHTDDEREWGRRNGVTDGLSFSHNLVSIFTPQLFASHPEFFPFESGQRAKPRPGPVYYNADLGREDVARYAAHAAARYFDAHPDGVSFSLGVNDGLLFGESPETLALTGVGSFQHASGFSGTRYFRGRPDYSPLVFTFMNRAAVELAKTHADKYLGCLAYYWCENAPPFPVDSHIIPFVTADRSQDYDPTFRREEFALQERWAHALGADRNGNLSAAAESFSNAGNQVSMTNNTEVAPRLGLYDYPYGQGFLIPRVPIHAFARHIKHAHNVGFTDYYGESAHKWALDGPMPWVIAQLLSDPSLDVDVLLDEYYTYYFQSAAVPMRRFFERCEQQWMQQSGPSYWLKYFRSESQADLFPLEVCQELRRLLDQAQYMAAAGPTAMGSDQPWSARFSRRDEQRVRDRVRFVSEAFGVTERFVALQSARHTLARAALDSNAPASELRSRLAAYQSARSAFIRYTCQNIARWPTAFCTIVWDDWLKDDPTAAAEFALQRYSISVTHGAGSTWTQQPITINSESAELLRSADLSGPHSPARHLAGLQYSIDLPRPWSSTVEPTEHGIAAVREVETNDGPQTTDNGRPRNRVLLFSGQLHATTSQWVPARPGRTYVARVAACGEVTSSSQVMLAIAFLNANQQRIGPPRAMYLPSGRWPGYVTLLQSGIAPPNAAWVGIGVYVQNQIGDDNARFRDFSLREVVSDRHKMNPASNSPISN